MKDFLEKLKGLLAKNSKISALEFIRNRGTSYSSYANKQIISATETVEFTTKSKQIIDMVKKDVSEINAAAKSNPEYLINYLEENGVKVFRIKNAAKSLEKISEHTGFICATEGKKALYLNTILNMGLSKNTEPMFVIDADNQIDYYLFLREFYLWYSMSMGLGGFEYKTQELLKKCLGGRSQDFSSLSFEELCAMKEAVARDSEANEFVMNVMRATEGGKNVVKKMQDGGAQI